MAESTQRLSPQLEAGHPEVPWDDIAGFRNRAVHAYLGIDLDIVWDILERDLPTLARVAEVEPILRRRRQGQLRDPGSDLGIDL